VELRNLAANCLVEGKSRFLQFRGRSQAARLYRKNWDGCRDLWKETYRRRLAAMRSLLTSLLALLLLAVGAFCSGYCPREMRWSHRRRHDQSVNGGRTACLVVNPLNVPTDIARPPKQKTADRDMVKSA
jgi:hypothetical protein